MNPLADLAEAALTLAGELALRPALVLAALAPLDAATAAAHLERRPELAAEVRALVAVESKGRRVGVHTGHARRRPGAAFWRAAVAAGWLDPAGCPEHALGDGARWGVRGPLGHGAALAVRHLGPCAAPEHLDHPLVAAVVAVRRLVELERRYGLRTREDRAEAWRRGVSAAKKRQRLRARRGV